MSPYGMDALRLSPAGLLLQAAMAGYQAGAGIPTNAAVSATEMLTMPGLVTRAPAHPVYYGLPWAVPGPASGAPYYFQEAM